MRYSLYEIDRQDVVATTVAADCNEALEWCSEKLRLMLTFEGDPMPYMAHTPKPTTPAAQGARSHAAKS
jgi:hypothetical protein